MSPRGKEPESPISSGYSTSTNLSPPFTYSTTRPPTSFSEIGFSTRSPKSRISSGYGYAYSKSPFPPPETPLPPIPDTSSTPATESRSAAQYIDRLKDGDHKNDGDQEKSADLYYRSDWLSTGGHDADHDHDQYKSATSSKWTRSSYKPSSRPFRANSNTQSRPSISTDGPKLHNRESDVASSTPEYPVKTPKTSKTTGKVQFADEQGQVIDSPNEVTPAPKKINNRSKLDTSITPKVGNEIVGRKNRQSTSPSIITLSHLTKNTVKKDDQKLGIVNPTPTYGIIGNSTNTTPATSPSTQLLSSEGKHDDSFLGVPNAGDVHDKLEIGSGPREIEIERDQGIYQRKPYQKSRTPDIQKQQTRLLDIKDQNKLGRMSVAPPRYTLPPPIQRQSRRVTKFEVPKSEDGKPKSQQANSGLFTKVLKTIRYSRLSKLYLTYKPFISPILSLTCALMLTVTHGTTSTSSIGEFLWVDKDVFDISRAGGTDIILGAWGWCQSGLNGPEPQCQSYDYRDFANDDLSFTIPGDSSLDNLSSLLTALTVLTWLLSTYQIITAFLHFYLFFALSVPFNHLVECTAPPPPPSANKSKSKSKSTKREIYGKDPFIAEVDLRVKCERFPYESYYWVWWAWWGHRRSPLQSVFGNLVGILGISTFAMTYKFKSVIIHATGSNDTDVAFGNGAYMSLMTILCTLDTFISSFVYFWNFRKNFNTFLNPPSPSPRVLLLPESENNLLFKHYQRRTGLQSFFAPISAGATVSPSAAHREPSRRFDIYLENPSTTPYTNVGTLGGLQQDDVSRLDEETIRWLSAYPHDNELVDLISGLRQGNHHSDFLLSDVGLLYLRPLSMDEGMALLIPPKGVIRNELLQDAHLDYYPGLSRDLPAGSSRGGTGEGEGEGEIEEAHNNLEIMIKILNQNFWWNGMEIDCKEFIENCQICFENLQKDTGVLNRQFPLNKLKSSS